MAKEKKDKTIEEMNAQEQNAELMRLRIAKERLELEHLMMTVENERARRDGIIRAHKQQQELLLEAQRQDRARQERCYHKKGGKNREGLDHGNDNNYSVWKHMYPWGEVGVLCSRCGKDWRKPSAELRATDPKAFAKQMAEYIEAINYPTDNEDSGTALFSFERTLGEAATASA